MGTGSGVSLRTWKRTALYRLYNEANELLYIGIAFNPTRRYNQHRKTKTWWPEVARKEVCWYENRTEAEDAEDAAIRDERPRYNIDGVEEPVRVPATPVLKPSRRPLLREVGELADELIAAESQVEEIRKRLHAKIREAGDPALGKAEKSGPSAIARAGRHRYTREYVGTLLKTDEPAES